MPVSVVIALGIVAFATWAHFAYWGRRLALRPEPDQLLFATTGDGWRIAVTRRRPRGDARRMPVLLCHGFANNRHAMDFAVPGHSLAVAIAARGFDTFVVDLRGHGLSRAAPGTKALWTLDDHLRQDIPAVLDAIREETGCAEVLWVGHSQGALLGMATCALHPDRVGGVVALAPPSQFGTTPGLRRFVRIGNLGLGGLLGPLARTFAPFGPIWHPSLAELAIRRANVEPESYRLYLANAVESENAGVLAHYAHLIEEDRFRAFDDSVDYGVALGTCRRPALFVSGERDGISPPSAVEDACVRWGGPKRYWSAGPLYGHADLLVGRRVAIDVFPRIVAWLEEQAPAAAATR